jgi:phosphonate transport system substrate-binding protein
MILNGSADVSSIDSTVLEMMFLRNSRLSNSVRIIESFGPAPMPPFVAGAHLGEMLHEKLTGALIRMNESKEGSSILAGAQMSRFVSIQDGDYDSVRSVLRRTKFLTDLLQEKWK